MGKETDHVSKTMVRWKLERLLLDMWRKHEDFFKSQTLKKWKIDFLKSLPKGSSSKIQKLDEISKEIDKLQMKRKSLEVVLVDRWLNGDPEIEILSSDDFFKKLFALTIFEKKEKAKVIIHDFEAATVRASVSEEIHPLFDKAVENIKKL